MTDAELLIPARFRGPNSSGNGGWTSGALAELVEACPTDHARPWPTIEVSLRRPPPLEVGLPVTYDDDTTVAHDADGRAVAEARRVDRELEPVESVSFKTARAAEAAYLGHREHPFPECFTCGPGRAEGDGLRVFPGQVGPGTVAATWTPHPSVAEDYHAYVDDTTRVSAPVTWAALDCPGGWSTIMEGRPAVLGRITARLFTLPVIGEPHVVVGQKRGEDGRKLFTASTLYDSDGREVARAEHVWLEVDPLAFR